MMQWVVNVCEEVAAKVRLGFELEGLRLKDPRKAVELHPQYASFPRLLAVSVCFCPRTLWRCGAVGLLV